MLSGGLLKSALVIRCKLVDWIPADCQTLLIVKTNWNRTEMWNLFPHCDVFKWNTVIKLRSIGKWWHLLTGLWRLFQQTLLDSFQRQITDKLTPIGVILFCTVFTSCVLFLFFKFDSRCAGGSPPQPLSHPTLLHHHFVLKVKMVNNEIYLNRFTAVRLMHTTCTH